LRSVQPECISCAYALTQILDLEDKIIYEHRSPEIKTGKHTKKQKKSGKVTT